MTKVDDARAALTSAEANVGAAERARDHARWALDNELATIGWHRMNGAFSPGATPLYTSPLFPGATLTAEQVITHLEQHRAAVA